MRLTARYDRPWQADLMPIVLEHYHRVSQIQRLKFRLVPIPDVAGMRNFFNDHKFRVETFAHIVPQVVKMGSLMLTKCVANSEAINEILDLFRFIVDKYSSMPTLVMPNSADQSHPAGQTVNDFLISMLQ